MKCTDSDIPPHLDEVNTNIRYEFICSDDLFRFLYTPQDKVNNWLNLSDEVHVHIRYTSLIPLQEDESQINLPRRILLKNKSLT